MVMDILQGVIIRGLQWNHYHFENEVDLFLSHGMTISIMFQDKNSTSWSETFLRSQGYVNTVAFVLWNKVAVLNTRWHSIVFFWKQI